MPQEPNFQTIMMTLQHFWAEKGCLIWQPYYSQVGAGTMNPATFLRVLGPEPWNVAYVEPSVRPDDGRYGDNPYRLQQHYQFQVILKPDPGNPQELYLQSLQALGIQPEQHDIRFVEDNWESPALGAWGLGWEVWLDGQEITQFTYFQQAGGLVLEPVSVEITYGLERIAMALQKNFNFKNIQWSPSFTYGDVNYQAEKEHSIYYFEEADIDRLRAMYQMFEKEADAALNKGLVLPAHDYVLKCSHTFNILDTRGAVGVTERQNLFRSMRELARRTAELYVAQREELGFPWTGKETISGSLSSPGQKDHSQLSLPKGLDDATQEDLLIEIGTEELPAQDLNDALEQVKQQIPYLFEKLRLSYESIHVMGTPRRIAVFGKNVSGKQSDLKEELKGPPADRAFDQDGNPTKAAIGFAKSKGQQVSQLKTKEIDGGQYVVAEIEQKGKSVFEVLPTAISDLVANIRFNKAMRWNESGVAFSRPIRWLVGLYGDSVVPFHYAGLTADRNSRGLRFSDYETYALKNANDYDSFLQKQNIICDVAQRSNVIADQVKDLLVSINASSMIDQNILEEVTNLTEAPTALLGNFNKKHLQLPEEVLVGVMKKHQRYFPVYDKKGALLPHFITVRNGGKQYVEIVARGNEEVIQARFADAAFFMREDSHKHLEDFIPSLQSLTFHPKLGSMLEKTKRIQGLVSYLSDSFKLDEREKAKAIRAAELCKADLATNMVVEMTSLQGTIGKYYALRSKEDAQIAMAIEEHYMPRQAGDASPSSTLGMIVAIADRLDSLVGLFSVGMAPTGTKDPFGLRRAAIGLIQILLDHQVDFDLRQALRETARQMPVDVDADTIKACAAFITARFDNMLLEEGHPYDVVNAILAEQGENPYSAVQQIKTLEKWVEKQEWQSILPAFSRCVRITREISEQYTVEPDLFVEEQEKLLFSGIQRAAEVLSNEKTIEIFIEQIIQLTPLINNFFDTVLVMDKDEAMKNNRLGMLQKIADMPSGLADLSELEGF